MDGFIEIVKKDFSRRCDGCWADRYFVELR